MKNITSREAGRVVAIGLTVTGLLLLALAQWIWAHRREIADTIARAVFRAYSAGRWTRTQLEAARAQLEATSERAATLVDAQPVPALAPISANLQALRELLELWVSRLYRQLAA
jgi:hypothetical protein